MRKERLEKVERAEKEEVSKKKEGSRLRNEATKDMVSQWFDGGQGCSKDVHCLKK
jgi:hypothetical protein